MPSNAGASMLLIITNSFDLTTDLLLSKLEGQAVFRFNFDHFSQYELAITKDGFTIVDPAGRRVDSESVYKTYWRKPFNAPSEEDYALAPFVDAELRYLLSEMVNQLWLAEKLVLVEPYAERRTGKLMQLSLAHKHFSVPTYEVSLNRKPQLDTCVVKSLSNALVDEGVFYTTRVETSTLSSKYPWFLESEVVAERDVTVVHVRGTLFAYSLERTFLKQSVDWRQFISPQQEWREHQLPAGLEAGIREYMHELRLDYGRLDFLLDDENRYWFCEVNANGQFAWLDLEDQDGLLSAVAKAISVNTPRYPIPCPHPLAPPVSRTRGQL